jgi:hypothetical protein
VYEFVAGLAENVDVEEKDFGEPSEGSKIVAL